jgi:hypothetical protein
MRLKSKLEIETEDYNEQQFILNRFPQAVWVVIDENRTKFYIPYELYSEAKSTIKEWETKNDAG